MPQRRTAGKQTRRHKPRNTAGGLGALQCPSRSKELCSGAEGLSFVLRQVSCSGGGQRRVHADTARAPGRFFYSGCTGQLSLALCDPCVGTSSPVPVLRTGCSVCGAVFRRSNPDKAHNHTTRRGTQSTAQRQQTSVRDIHRNTNYAIDPGELVQTSLNSALILSRPLICS